MLTKSQRNPWLSCPRPNPRAHVRLFCFPYAGGSAAIYRGWPERLGANVEVQLLHLPGRGNRIAETPFRELLPLAAAVGEAIRPALDKPFAFFGHSMGALLGFELARYLRRVGAPAPSRLFLSGRNAPHLSKDDPPTFDLPEAEFVEELRRLDGTPPEVLEHPELLDLMIPILRADFSVCQTYAYTPAAPLESPLTVFGGLEDPDVPRADLEAWREHTRADFKLWTLPGGHFFINTAPDLLLKILAQELSELTRAITLGNLTGEPLPFGQETLSPFG